MSEYTYIYEPNYTISTTLDSRILLERPIYDERFNFFDEDVKFIADYLFTELNITFYRALKGNIVKTIRYENDPFIPVVDFPVLKVYKNGYDDDATTSNDNSTKYTIAYALAYTKRNKLAGVGSYVADEIVRLLKTGSAEGKFQLDASVPISITFDDFINPENVIYKYTTITTNFLCY